MVLRKGYQNGNYDVLYVGQTGDLSERFDNHHKKPCLDRNRKTHVAAMVEPSEARRLSVEADLIRKYHPNCNS
jgi:excinuclease UvrABC nuclease subunit